MVEVLPIDTPTLGDRSYLAHDGEVGSRRRPPAGHRPHHRPGRRAGRAHHPRRRDAHAQRLRHRRAGARPGGRRAATWSTRPTRSASTAPRSGTATACRSARRCGCGCWPRPGTRSPTCPTCWKPTGEVAGVFTGGSLLYGSTGRPDLLGPDNTAALARAQYALGPPPGPRAARLGGDLPDARIRQLLRRHPGAGAVVHDRAGEAVQSRAHRRASRCTSTTLLAGLDAWPAYYAHMGPANTAGPAGPDLSPPRRADAAEVRRRDPGRRVGG